MDDPLGIRAVLTAWLKNTGHIKAQAAVTEEPGRPARDKQRRGRFGRAGRKAVTAGTQHPLPARSFRGRHNFDSKYISPLCLASSCKP